MSSAASIWQRQLQPKFGTVHSQKQPDAFELDLPLVGNLLGLLAHDLRNPLSALHSNVSFLSSTLEETDGDVQEALSDGLVSCEGLRHIIDNLDLLGQYMRGASQPPRVKLSLASLIEDSVGRCQRSAASYGVTLRVQISERDQRQQVIGIRELLARALVNLVQNCIQYSASNAVVVLFARTLPGEVQIMVADQGVPFEPSDSLRLFSPAGQVASKASHSGSRYGRGLGLLASRIAATATGAQVGTTEAPEAPFTNCFTLSVPAGENNA
jgi:signal transduction histidine kinase